MYHETMSDIKTLPADFAWLPEMYADSYFPNFLVDKVKSSLETAAAFIGQGGHTTEEIQDVFDQVTNQINDLNEEFEGNGSELETAARDSIGETVFQMLSYFGVDLDVEDALRDREW